MAMEIIVSVVLLFVGIAVLVAIHVCIVGRAFRRGYETGQEIGPGSFSSSRYGIKKISNEELKNLPCFDYKAAEKEGSSSSDCVVCLENFNVGDKCKLLPNCKHSFHSQCIDSWLVKTPICPICRTIVNTPKIHYITNCAIEDLQTDEYLIICLNAVQVGVLFKVSLCC
ncbi:E3 ubiquitin-protein ligase ATL4 [Ricinus communis]|uniref:E3 ubiquitin-protein ligase ATL4 n=1 Tax=Ricinus communis TaxID=3988 RepID=UPI0007726A0A|nr:E3 ubiquitin-protein ligase ATL4 [Ricinus communis]|eukprot:XP_015577776.1 E3 ubiquitin-protein ligase ATL4 [Ricinus communis]